MAKNYLEVLDLSRKVVRWLRPFSKKIEIAGSIRRKEKKPGDIDIVLIPKDKQKILDFLKMKGRFILGGEKKATFRINRIKVELYYTNEKSWGATLLAYSSRLGSAIGLRMVAKRKGYKLNQYGLFRKGEFVAGKTEESIYRTLGRKYKEPWER
jgi:DNA polymerase (family 10)